MSGGSSPRRAAEGRGGTRALKRYRFITVGVDAGRADVVRDAAGDLGRVEVAGPVSKREFVHIRVLDAQYDDLLVRIRRVVPEPQDGWAYREECVFTRREIESSELLAVQINQAPREYLGAPGGVKYDYAAAPSRRNPAPWCWQASPVRMRKSHFPRGDRALAHTIAGEVIVHVDLVVQVGALAIDTVQLLPIDVPGVSVDLGWRQLAVRVVMPAYSAHTTGFVPGAEQPKQTGVITGFDEYSVGYWPAYRRADVAESSGGLPELSFTRELYGEWAKRPEMLWAPPQPRLVVSQRTRQELKAAGVRGLRYTPIRLLD